MKYIYRMDFHFEACDDAEARMTAHIIDGLATEKIDLTCKHTWIKSIKGKLRQLREGREPKSVRL